MNFFEKIRRKKEVKEYIDQTENNLKFSLNQAKTNLVGIKYCLKECGKYLDLNNKDHVYMQEAYTKRIIEKSPTFCKSMIIADKLFEDLKKYIEENIDFVGHKHKSNVKTFEELFTLYKKDFVHAYVDAENSKIESKHSAAIIKEFNKVVESLPHSDILRTKEDNSDLGINDGV
jgi:hypothetical protein